MQIILILVLILASTTLADAQSGQSSSTDKRNETGRRFDNFQKLDELLETFLPSLIGQRATMRKEVHNGPLETQRG